jgi:hypothetical protein
MHELTPQDQLKRFLKARANLDGKDSVFWWKGYVYSYIPGQASQRLFLIEGYNIARIENHPDGYRMITREVTFYSDPVSGDILERWHNPLNGRDVQVIQVWNDPVNQEFRYNGPRGPFAVPAEDLGNGTTCLYFDVLLAYPSPLPRSQYPLNSQSDLYQGAELFQFFVDTTQLNDPTTTDIACSNSWTRFGPWLPWMEMGDCPGNLIYQCRGAKLSNGFASLPQHIQDYVMQHQPKYAEAPREFVTPNETSWTYFKKLNPKLKG